MAVGFMGAQQYTIRLMLDSGGAVRGLATFENRWRRFTSFTSRFRAGMLGMNTMLMGQGAVMVGVGLAVRGAIRSYERYSDAQAELRAILTTTNIDLRVHDQLMQVADIAARRFGFGMAERTQGLSHFAEMGFNAHEMLQYFTQAVEFARG